jgi:ankyrin repeat protein
MQERKQFQGNAQARKIAKTKVDIEQSEKSVLSAKEQKRLNDALLTAAENGDNAKIIRLIKIGADIAAQTDKGATALQWIAYNGHTKNMQFTYN